MTDSESIEGMISKEFEKRDEQVKETGELLKANYGQNLNEFIKHENCNNSECGVCSMKNTIHQNAYKKGFENGVKISKKFPNTDFGVTNE